MTSFVYDKFVYCYCCSLFISDSFPPRRIPFPIFLKSASMISCFYLLQCSSTVLVANDFLPPEFKFLCRSSSLIKIRSDVIIDQLSFKWKL